VGLGVVAGLLFLLQRLRVRHRAVVVITTLFWQEAKEEARARTLVERFRHPLAYLLALLVAGLAWLAFADPIWRDGQGTRYTVLLDGSAAMARADRFDAAKDAVEDLAGRLPRGRSEVIWCGSAPQTLLAPGEDRSLLAMRLANLQPEATPSSIGRAIAMAAASRPMGADSSGTVVVVVGEAPEDQADVPSDLRWVHLPVGTDEVDDGARIVALGVSPADQVWGQVDALLTVRGGDGQAPQVGLGDVDWKGTVLRTQNAGETQYQIRGLPADGAVLHVRLAGDSAQSLASQAHLRLPKRAPIRVWVAEDARDGALQQVLQADSAIEQVADPAQADVVVLGSAQAPAKRPALRWVATEDQPQAILLQHEAELDSQDVLRYALGEFGLDRIDATEMAQTAGQAIELGAQVGDQREVRVWRSLLASDRYGLVESRAFPLLVGRGLRWLAQQAPVVPYVAAGRRLPMPLASDASGFAPAEDLLPTVAGSFAGPDGGAWEASLLAPWDPIPWAGGVASPADGLPTQHGSLFTWIVLLVLALLGLEWILFGSGRIP